jgi:hypothetical protein
MFFWLAWAGFDRRQCRQRSRASPSAGTGAEAATDPFIAAATDPFADSGDD